MMNKNLNRFLALATGAIPTFIVSTSAAFAEPVITNNPTVPIVFTTPPSNPPKPILICKTNPAVCQKTPIKKIKIPPVCLSCPPFEIKKPIDEVIINPQVIKQR
jgi:hypothetical protein